ncbi:hypothetical protein BASA81_006813 [Batrachochytrium salamandrivorans]|nr:hypothetical protein BASA81_006813 [Batrachochytrium salamandrivorans]
MLLVPHSSPPPLAPRYAAWPDGTCVAISSNQFSTPFGGWMFTSPNLLLEIVQVAKEEGGAVFVIFKRVGGVFTSPRLDPNEVLFVDSLLEGQLHGQGGVFSPNNGPASTCLDVLDSVVAAGDAWGRIALWDITQSSPPVAVFGAHGKLGCSAVRLFSGRRMVTVGGERNELKLWDLVSLRCLRGVDTGLAITTQPCLFHEDGGGVMVAAAGTSCGRVVFWGDTTPQLLSSEVACLVEYKGLVCACAADGEFALWGAGKLVNRGKLPRPFCGLLGNGLVLAANEGGEVSVQDLVRWRPALLKPSVPSAVTLRSGPKRAKQADASLPPFAQDKRRSSKRSFYLTHNKNRFYVQGDNEQ